MNPSSTLRSIRMDGTDEKLLRKFDSKTKYDISIDPWQNRVYWLDFNKLSVESVSLEGTFELSLIFFKLLVSSTVSLIRNKWFVLQNFEI